MFRHKPVGYQTMLGFDPADGREAMGMIVLDREESDGTPIEFFSMPTRSSKKWTSEERHGALYVHVNDHKCVAPIFPYDGVHLWETHIDEKNQEWGRVSAIRSGERYGPFMWTLIQNN